MNSREQRHRLRARYAAATPKPLEPSNPTNPSHPNPPTEPPKGGEPMTAEEKAAFDALKSQVDKLQARQQMEVPVWAKANLWMQH